MEIVKYLGIVHCYAMNALVKNQTRVLGGKPSADFEFLLRILLILFAYLFV